MASSGFKAKGVTLLLVLSYVSDWVVICAAAGLGAYLATLTPNRRPFSLSDPTISFPLVHQEQIPIWLCGVLAILAPAAIIFLVSFLLVPGPTVPASTPKALIWRRKLWEWYAGWAGLGLSSAAAFFIISGMKNLFGKPRPHTLAACIPDMTEAAIARYKVYNTSLLVSAEICTQTDAKILRDTFRSFPSGHASTSAAGLVYLSLFLASKLAITIPFLAPRTYTRNTKVFSAFPSRAGKVKQTLRQHDTDQNTAYTNKNRVTEDIDGLTDPNAGPSNHNDAEIAARSQSAAPPLYLLILAVAPTAVAVYICATRFSDFYHFGFDLLFGFAVGTLTAIYSFRFYHLPISQGAGWAWGPRSSKRAFWAGVGVGTYAVIRGDEDEDGDVERATGEHDDMIELLPRTRTNGAMAGASNSSIGVDGRLDSPHEDVGRVDLRRPGTAM